VVPSPFSPDGDGIDDVAFLRYTLDAAVSLARVRIYDASGREVYEHEAELAGRDGQLAWDGRSSSGERLRIGIYVVLFEALDADGGAVEVFKEPVVLARPLE
jgi:flagellar hook assembly protein FlgD